MKKKDIKTFFQDIRNSDLQKVTELVSSDKEYLTATNFAPPKKDDGQSGLQVAFKTANFDIAEYLIEQGADINFIEKSDINDWKAPVLHDCIRATIFNSYTIQKDTSQFDRAFSLLKTLLIKKADPNAVDSYGNNCLNRALMDAKQMLDNPSTDFTNGILLQQLRNVFSELIKAGADPNQSSEKRESFASNIVNDKMEQYQLW
jgi:ankyrin repeat protein